MTNLIQHFAANTEGRDLVVGDIHGCMSRFWEVLGKSGFDRSRDRLFSVGDLIDRGPNSLEAISLIDEPWFHAVKGNHEEMLIGVVTGDWDAGVWMSNGGDWVLELEQEQVNEIARKLDKLPLAITVGEGADRFNVVHAEFFGSDDDLDLGVYSHINKERMLWGRSLVGNEILKPVQEGLSKTYCGHTILKEPIRIQQQFFLDTGSFLRHGKITIHEPKTGMTWHSTSDRF